eukprot:CAMPEP_0174840936 /NCGR_PEP_ID=MMETSP1114-20130205/8996_1 /TAXON_ID=312471 /ORGANISM="Neobodo designis, Strain CCAP 1951/1" /LENGTH=129 /DNA_ID=CAMNT_0016075105 /DNA_START=36 /DNA_END=422 /DNA_ORIENTATION=-
MVLGLLGISPVTTSVFAATSNVVSAVYFGALPGGRAMVKWGGFSNAGIVITGMYFGKDDPFVQHALVAIACSSMGAVMGLHAVRIAGTTAADHVLHTRIAAGGFGVLALDQYAAAYIRRPAPVGYGYSG